MAETPPDTNINDPDTQNVAETPPDSSSPRRGSLLDTDSWGKPAVDPEANIPVKKKIKSFCGTHFLGIVAFVLPIIFTFCLASKEVEKWQWCAYTLCVMAGYWVFECIPLPVTSFLPVIIFPLTDIMSTRETCLALFNDTIVMFLGSIMLAASVEQSGLHKRLALYAIKIIGYSHKKILLAIAFVTMFVSMWVTNTAAATMMVPIIFALLEVYEKQKLMNIYNTDPKTGEKSATELTSCYFCCTTFAATIGGVGTLVGTGTNLAFKGQFMKVYPDAPEYISFPLYSAWAVPYMIVLNVFMYLYLTIMYMGLFRPNSKAAKSIKITPEGLKSAKEAVQKEIRAIGSISCHEIMVLILFSAAILLFFSRSPQVFPGWADRITGAYGIDKKFIKDSAAATFVIFLMLFLPSCLSIFKNCSAKYTDQLPNKSVTSVLDWDLMNKTLPYSFCFLLAGGFALSLAARPKYSDLNGKIGEVLANLQNCPNAAVMLIIIIVTVFITNFASNVAICNVIAPIAMNLAEKVSVNPLWYCIAAGVSASFCFMIPVGTPGNLIVQAAAKMPTKHMIIAGAGPTFTTIILTLVFLYFYAPVIWPIVYDPKPDWLK